MSLKLYFGPYQAHGVIRHKTQKLYGITNELTNLGYDVESIPTKRLNSLIVHYKNKEIYRCDIRYLMFNTDYEDDPVAQNLVKAVEDAKSLFEAEQNVSNFGVTNTVPGGDTEENFAGGEGEDFTMERLFSGSTSDEVPPMEPLASEFKQCDESPMEKPSVCTDDKEPPLEKTTSGLTGPNQPPKKKPSGTRSYYNQRDGESLVRLQEFYNPLFDETLTIGDET